MNLAPAQHIAVLIYGSSKLEVWDVEENKKLGHLQRRGKRNVEIAIRGVILRRVNGTDLLAVSYDDGDLVTYSPWTLEPIEGRHFNTAFDYLSATSDGHILVGEADDGSIHLLLFETLQPMYRIPPFEGDAFEPSRGLTFSTDNLKLFDLRAKCCNIWSPPVLVSERYRYGKHLDTTCRSKALPPSDNINSTVIPSQTLGLASAGSIKQILTIKGSLLFIGRVDGFIEAYEVDMGGILANRFQPLSCSRFDNRWTMPLDWNSSKKLLLSSTGRGQCIVTYFDNQSRHYTSKLSCCHHYEDGELSPRQGILNPDGTRLLIAYENRARLISVNLPQARSEDDGATGDDVRTDEYGDATDDDMDDHEVVQNRRTGRFLGN